MQAKGKTYEKKVGRELSRRVGSGLWEGFELLAGQWIKFRDANGPGYAQPDFILFSEDILVILDAKLTHTEMAFRQLRGLYLPLCSFLWPGKVEICVEVCHNPGTGSGFLKDLDDCLEEEKDFHIWHWLG